MNNEMKSSLTATDTWKRGLFMVLFVVIYSIAEFVLGMIVFFQFLHVLFNREINERLRELTTDISVFIYQILQFLTFNSEVKPYPFAAWPDGPADLESLDMDDVVDAPAPQKRAPEASTVADVAESDIKAEVKPKAKPEAKPDAKPDDAADETPSKD
jgi:hypothetical protein